MILADRTQTLELEPKDFRLNGNTINDDIVDSSNFGVGSAIGKTVTIVLDNTDERFSLIDFYGAVFTLYVGLPLNDDGTNVEKIRIGQFTVITPATTGTLISIEAVDNMYKFDKPYENSHLRYPATLGEIINNACLDCGVNNNAGRFSNYNYYVEAKPQGDFTYRQIISYVAQIACVYAKIDDRGGLYFDWMEDVTPEGEADGGNYRTIYDEHGYYLTGDTLDGGTFAYNDGDNFDGGRFTDAITVHNLGAAKSVKVGTDDIVITGVKVTNGKDKDGNEQGYHCVVDAFNSGKSYAIGDIVSIWNSDDYTLYKFIQPHEPNTPWDLDEVAEALDYDIVVSDNPLTVGSEETICKMLATKLCGFRFRPFSLSYLQDPTIESGDWVFVTDIKRNTYKSFVTNAKFTTMGYMTISCNAQPPSRVASTYSSMAASAIVKQSRLTDQKISNYEAAIQRMNALMANAMGLHTYEKTLEDGSKIYYMSNKPITDENGTPRFTEHSKVWKISGEGFALCYDAEPYDTPDPRTGCQWVSGWDSDGNVVVNSLSAIGISFDWAHGGTLTLGGDNNINGVLSVLNTEGRERARIDNRGVFAGDEVGSKIWINTEGEMQYFLDDVYQGKMKMRAINKGTVSEPKFEDTLSILDFDHTEIDNGYEHFHVGTVEDTSNNKCGEINIYTYADDNFGSEYDGGIFLNSHRIYIGGSGIGDGNEPTHVELDGDLYFNTYVGNRKVHIQGGEAIYTTAWLVGSDKKVHELEYRSGWLTKHAVSDEAALDFWHTENGYIMIIVLQVGSTECTFNQLESSDYSYEPHIKCASGVEAPVMTGISISGSSLTVKYTAVTAAQAGSGNECQMKLRVIV